MRGVFSFAFRSNGLNNLAKETPRQSILVNLSGRGDKDIDYVVEKYGIR